MNWRKWGRIPGESHAGGLSARLREYIVRKAEVPARRRRFRRAAWQRTGGEQNPKDQSRIS